MSAPKWRCCQYDVNSFLRNATRPWLPIDQLASACHSASPAERRCLLLCLSMSESTDPRTGPPCPRPSGDKNTIPAAQGHLPAVQLQLLVHVGRAEAREGQS